ncbi:cellulose biosynthesis protein BcsQ [Hoeflea halophila]|uniref:Cellulose biosynthesis protein BcsQ n=1 Tax=Hoeflea halophila TaxID=714899 RepID=A0A286HRS0_9HYPH|nr:AAA family ATPase [Hoeflea halophila]SOE10495.1 cellulose biosynthesis protein BcsQ [Hoeflea halophila]
MKSIAMFNNKGGVGKTTLLTNLASILSSEFGLRVLLIDADPQCNASQLMFNDEVTESLYEKSDTFTIYSVLHPLSLGKGYSDKIKPFSIENFGFDILIGDPRLALKEDLLAKDWASAVSGEIRGLRTTFVFSELLSRCRDYDYVFFDMGPSLGSINRSCLLACDFFVSPMSIDIFSLRAIDNIKLSIQSWKKNLSIGINNVEDPGDLNDMIAKPMDIKFGGYVTQQYIAKTTGDGEKRAVKSYEKIMKRFEPSIRKNFVDVLQPNAPKLNYKLGSIPNLHSLVPMAQFARKPIFELKAKDGVVGAHFAKVNESKKLFEEIAGNMINNLADLND